MWTIILYLSYGAVLSNPQPLNNEQCDQMLE